MAVSKENACAFYASDYHLEMIMLPYINENLKKDKKIYIFTENNLEDTVKTLIEKVNLESGIKEKILNINWKNEDEEKYKTMLNDEKQTIVFIKGNKEYIENINKDINKMNKTNSIEVIDCYNISEIGTDVNNIIKEHNNNILATNGKNKF